jgi:hypothetical protein
MFEAFISKFKAEPQPNPVLDQANSALKERVAHMFWASDLKPNVTQLEAKRHLPVKNAPSIRKAIAA